MKPPISEVNRVARLQWALEHVNWTDEQWEKILWTDETWVTGGRHTRVWVTRKHGEELEPTCVVERIPRKRGWMFWGSISGGLGKGVYLFCEKVGARSTRSPTDSIRFLLSTAGFACIQAYN
jgi:hypothetical protein